MSALSTHLISAYTGLINPAALPPFASFSQTARTPPTLAISGPMSYNAAMHGNFNAYPSFSNSHSHSQQPQPPVGGGYNPNIPQQADVDLSVHTAQQIATLQAKLNKKLGPEFISQRPGPGGQGKLTYAEGWKIINLANEVFGFNGWSSSITSLAIDYIDYNEQTQRYCVGVTAIVKVTLRDGVYHEDVGFGMLDNCRQKGMALDKCKKEAVTDALKRTLRNFGNLLGNCLYDKEYAKEVVKIQLPPPKFNRSELHRRPEYSDPPTGSNLATCPSNAGPSNMGPPPTVPVRTSLAQAGPAPQLQRQAQQTPRQIETRHPQEHSVRPTILQPERQPRQSPIAKAKPAPATTSTIARSDILAALAGLSPVSAPSPLLPTDTPLQPESTVLVPPTHLVQPQLQPPPRQPHPPQRAIQLPKELSQEFADFADGDDSFYNDLNLESFDASKTLVDALGLDPSPSPPLLPPTETSARPTVTATDAKGKGRMSEIISGLLGDSPQPDRSFGIGPSPEYASPMPPSRTSSFTTATGSAAVKGNQGGGGFVIPAGVTRPNRSVPPPHPGKVGVKRSAEEAFASSKAATTGVPVVGGKATADRTVFGELEVGSDGAVLKRVRR